MVTGSCWQLYARGRSSHRSNVRVTLPRPCLHINRCSSWAKASVLYCCLARPYTALADLCSSESPLLAAMAVSLLCKDCNTLLRNVAEAQAHNEATGHANFEESTQPVITLVCTACGKPCRSDAEKALHTKFTGHTEYVDKVQHIGCSLNEVVLLATYQFLQPQQALLLAAGGNVCP
eukprot:GHUV01039879.1.p1 GENE.GHUV01039879.1~~GHUV01039879.1.p1  ORF type:complete len:177 (+),score=26.06 GHUV01039879.1:125-655(+)